MTTESSLQRQFAFVTGVLICALSTPAVAQSSGDWVDIKDPEELRALYSNKTFRGHGWVGHYRPDGRGIVITDAGGRFPRTWQVKGNDQICVTTEVGAPDSYRSKRHSKNRNEILLTGVENGVSRQFTVEEGVPKF